MDHKNDGVGNSFVNIVIYVALWCGVTGVLLGDMAATFACFKFKRIFAEMLGEGNTPAFSAMVVAILPPLFFLDLAVLLALGALYTLGKRRAFLYLGFFYIVIGLVKIIVTAFALLYPLTVIVQRLGSG